MAKMNEDIKMQRSLAKLAKLMGTAAPVAPEKITREMAREARATKPAPFYEAEAVLFFLEKPARFMVKPCKREECKEPFGTNYRGVAYCSDKCRIKELKRQGILWNPSKQPEERWGGEPPLIIPPEALKALMALAQIQSSGVNPWSLHVEEMTASQEEVALVPPQQEELVFEHMDPSNESVISFDTTDQSLEPPLTSELSFQLEGLSFEL